MIVANFVWVLGLVVSSFGRTIPASKVDISDNGLFGYIDHQQKDNDDSGLLQGHGIYRRSYGPEFNSEIASEESQDKRALFEGESGEDMENAESRYGGYSAGFHSFLPYPPSNHGPHPGPYPPAFGQQHHQFPGHGSQNGWNNNFGHGNGYGPGQGFNHGHGYNNGHGQCNLDHGHGYGQGHGQGHNQGHGHGYGHQQGFGNGHENGFGYGHDHGHGHGHGHGYDHNSGHGYGHGHGHGHGHGPDDDDCNIDHSMEDNNQSMESTQPATPPTVTQPPITPSPFTPPPITSAPIRTTEKIITPPTTTVDPIYDIDVRLGTGEKK